ncbi:MAG: hypothetical protein RH946_17530 [Rhodospirillales bacterium]
MQNVEFVYEQSCPFVRDSRRRLIEAFKTAGVTPCWTEWEISDPRAPEHVRKYGSPTILVDGRDIAGAPHDEATNCCRIYVLGDEPTGVPPLEMVVGALTAEGGNMSPTTSTRDAASIRTYAAALPTIGIAALPKLTCPACWPAYTGLLSSFGIGFANYTPYLLPLTTTFLALSVFALAYRAQRRRGFGPFSLGAVAALTALAGKFGFDSDSTMWAGLGLLVIASVWNSWPICHLGSAARAAKCGHVPVRIASTPDFKS